MEPPCRTCNQNARGRYAYASHSCSGMNDLQLGSRAIPRYRCGAYVVVNIEVNPQGAQNEDGSIDASLDVTLVRLPPGDPGRAGAVQFSEALTLAPAKVAGGPILIADASRDSHGG